MRNYQRKIKLADVDYEGIFEFYQRLERRQRSDWLRKLCMVLSVPIMFWMSLWCGVQYVDWTPVSRAMHVASSGNGPK